MKAGGVALTFSVVRSSEGAPEAILGAPTEERPPGMAWHGLYCHVRALHRVARLLPAGAIFCAELTERWGCLVVGTPEFCDWWRGRPAASAPESAFLLEVWQ